MRGEFSAKLRPSRLRSALVVSQVTVCLVLLVHHGGADTQQRVAAEHQSELRNNRRWSIPSSSIEHSPRPIFSLCNTWRSTLGRFNRSGRSAAFKGGTLRTVPVTPAGKNGIPAGAIRR